MTSLISQLRTVRIKCQSEFHVRQHIKRIVDALDMGTCAVSNCHNQVQVLGSDSLLSSLWIHMGEHIKAHEERILQDSTTSEEDDSFLASNEHPDRLLFKGEGSSVLFKLPQVIGSSLKSMTLHIVYSSSLANMTSKHLRSVLIVNHTKATIQIHKQEALISPSVEEWKDMISNLEPGDKVEIVVVFGHGLNVKNTTVYLIYGESVDQNTECSSGHSNIAINSKRCLDKEEDRSFEKGQKKMKM
ncbi:TMV resistance protein N [Senna tora]|uniref:TMV resistance protein N n=1 Tax=Senna tora TaxID=362788 RepID=A0A835CJ26_9FABA|nr:TMV resistance protein N [Senna tora]